MTNQSPLVQTKPLVSQPGDRDEQEADRAAAHVLSGEAAPLSAGEPSIQRQVADEEEEAAAPVAETAPPVESTEPEETATAEPAATTEAPSVGLIVEDGTSPGPGQMSKTAFLDELRASACAAADAELTAVGRSTEGCPYVEKAIGYYRTKDTAHIERATRKYAPETARVTSARDYIPLVTERIRQGVARWAQTGDMSDVPEELLSQAMGGGVLGGIAGAISSVVSGIGSLLFKAREGGAKEAEPQAIRSQLSSGSPLDGGVRTRMESAFGYDFSRVRVHTDGQAANLSSGLNARAFTIGSDVAFGAGEYQPGTVVGDALLAHELAHVVQQGGGATTEGPQQKGNGAYTGLEEDADRSAVGAVVSMWSGAKNGLTRVAQSAMPQLKSGLRLSRCKSGGSTSAGALPKKTVTVNPTKLYGSTGDVNTALTYANTKVYNQANIEIKKGDEPTPLDEAKTKAILGLDAAGKGNLILDVSSSAATVEEKELFKLNQKPDAVTVYYIKELSSGNLGEAWHPSSGQGVGVELSNSGTDNTFSHELGHVLLDSSGHTVPDNTYLMHATAPDPTKLTPDEITKMRGSTFAK